MHPHLHDYDEFNGLTLTVFALRVQYNIVQCNKNIVNLRVTNRLLISNTKRKVTIDLLKVVFGPFRYRQVVGIATYSR